MPLTRLANAAIHGVRDAPAAVTDEIAKYLGTDLLCYRADAPAALSEKQSAAWDPVAPAWAHKQFGARFMLAQGVMHVTQPRQTVIAMRAAIPRRPVAGLAAVSSIAALTGSALLALALAHDAIDAEMAWAASHVDEDWQMSQWGKDDLALERRAFRRIRNFARRLRC